MGVFITVPAELEETPALILDSQSALFIVLLDLPFIHLGLTMK